MASCASSVDEELEAGSTPHMGQSLSPLNGNSLQKSCPQDPQWNQYVLGSLTSRLLHLNPILVEYSLDQPLIGKTPLGSMFEFKGHG